jgi:hypothetical protein
MIKNVSQTKNNFLRGGSKSSTSSSSVGFNKKEIKSPEMQIDNKIKVNINF